MIAHFFRLLLFDPIVLNEADKCNTAQSRKK